MAQTPKKAELLILEYNGTARSGKGSIVSHLADHNVAVATEETGIDYRAITRALLSDGSINLEMSLADVTRKVESIGLNVLIQLVADRNAILDKYGRESLYRHDVNEFSAVIARVGVVRRAVKEGFRARVETVRDTGEYRTLLVDGRHLAAVIRDIPHIRLLLRTFVTCSSIEAALRECLRMGFSIESERGRQVLESIEKRNQADATREIDPVKPDTDALDYWHPLSTTNSLAALAVQTNRQIYFDTTPFRAHSDPKAAMLEAAQKMFEDALAAA